MLLYSWNKIKTRSKTLRDVISILYILTGNNPLLSKRLHKYANYDYSGTSFLLDPTRLLAADATPAEKVGYLFLASKRNYANYLLTGETRLDQRLVTKQPLEPNRLLTIENNYISFAYEQGKK